MLLLDLTMPQLDGLDVIRQVRATAPKVRILVLSMHESPEFVRPAMRAGAHRTSLMRKLQVHSAQAIAVLAVRRGIIVR